MSSIEILKLVTGMLSGLSLFLFGMNVMSMALTQAAGGRLNGMIEKITKNRFAGWLFGTGLAAFVQSSATTVMVVGLVSSGIMTLAQSVGVIIGANLGTTATAWLLSLNSLGGSFWIELLKPSTFTPFLAVIAVVTLMFAKSDKKKEFATILLGFSVMMIGMNLISTSVEPLESIPSFNSILLRFSNPILGFLVGIICTLIIQSSAGTIGIVQAFAMSVGITYGMAIPIICGAQAGTCLTAVLVSLSSNNNGKRTALIHLLYNLLRNIPFLVVFTVLSSVAGLSLAQSTATSVGVAAFHSLINIAGSVIFLPLSGLLVALVMRFIPYSEAERREQEDTLTMLDPILLYNPPFALDQTETATGMLAAVVREAFAEFLQVFEDQADVHRKKVQMLCLRAKRYEEQLSKYLIKISESSLQDDSAKKLSTLSNTVDDYGDIGGLLTSMLDTLEVFKKKEGSFSEEAKKDLKFFGSAVQEILDTTESEFELRNVKLAGTIQVYREVITDIHSKISKKHVRRLHMGECRPENNILFTNICLGYERIIDRCDSIASNILIDSADDKPVANPRQYEIIKQLFADKYSEIED